MDRVRNLEALLDSGYPSTLFGRPVVMRNDDLETEMKRLLDAGLIRWQACDEDDLLALNGDPSKSKPAGVLRVKASPLKIHRPEAL